MSGVRTNGAQHVFIAGTKTGAISGGGAITVKSELTPIGAHVRDASLGTANTLTPPAGANLLEISAETQPVRLRYDGSAATATEGFLLTPGDVRAYNFASGTTFSVIETAAGAIIQYQWSSI